jgi:hypothetical protein
MNDLIERCVTETILDLPITQYISNLNEHVDVITIESQCILIASNPNQPVHQAIEDNAIQATEKQEEPRNTRTLQVGSKRSI